MKNNVAALALLGLVVIFGAGNTTHARALKGGDACTRSQLRVEQTYRVARRNWAAVLLDKSARLNDRWMSRGNMARFVRGDIPESDSRLEDDDLRAGLVRRESDIRALRDEGRGSEESIT
jgi:hypothetical protein